MPSTPPPPGDRSSSDEVEYRFELTDVLGTHRLSDDASPRSEPTPRARHPATLFAAALVVALLGTTALVAGAVACRTGCPAGSTHPATASGWTLLAIAGLTALRGAVPSIRVRTLAAAALAIALLTTATTLL